MAQGGSSPVDNGQLLFLLVGAAVALLAVVIRCQGEAGWGAELHCGPSCWSLAPQWCADLPGQGSQLYFASAGEKTEQVVSGVLNPVFFLSTKFSLEVFPLW